MSERRNEYMFLKNLVEISPFYERYNFFSMKKSTPDYYDISKNYNSYENLFKESFRFIENRIYHLVFSFILRTLCADKARSTLIVYYQPLIASSISFFRSIFIFL